MRSTTTPPRVLVTLVGLVVVLLTSLLSPVAAQTTSTTKPEEVVVPSEVGKFEPFDTPASEQSVRVEQVADAASGYVEPLPTEPALNVGEFLEAGPMVVDNPLDGLVAPAVDERDTTDRGTEFEGTPFGIEIPARDRIDRNDTSLEKAVELEVLDPEEASKLSDLGTVFTLEVSGYGNRPTPLPLQEDKVEVDELGRRNRLNPEEVDLGDDSGSTTG